MKGSALTAKLQTKRSLKDEMDNNLEHDPAHTAADLICQKFKELQVKFKEFEDRLTDLENHHRHDH